MHARHTRRVLVMLFCAAVPLLAAGCGNDDTNTIEPTNYAPFSATDVRVGTGPTLAAAGDTLEANYAGWFYDGTKADKKGVQFTSSTASGSIEFVLGTGSVIDGWEKGLVGMRQGGIRRLIVPPSMAYGATRYGVIPANTTLVFEVEIVAHTPAGTTAAAAVTAR